jgi:transposase InsO family protein
LADLSNFNFSIRYKPGPKNIDADALSRIVWTEDQVKSALAGVSGVDDGDPVVNMQQNIVMSDGSSTVLSSAVEWQQMQRKDAVLSPVISVLLGNDKPQNVSHETKCLMMELKRLFLENGVLCRRRIIDGETSRQIVLPANYTRKVFDELHTKMGHPGRDKTTELIRERFYWPKMSVHIGQWVKHCDRCIRRKSVPDIAPLHPITSSQPLELVCIDYLGLETCKGKYKNVLVITDHFTRYAIAIATTNQSAKTTAKVLMNHFIQHYGFPLRLHSDNGGSFEGHVIKELCKLVGIEKSRTTPFHPRGNGACERMNQSLLGLLRSLTSEQKSCWKDQLSYVVHAYNCMRHESTGFSPFELMYGRKARLPIDLMLSLNENVKHQSYQEFVSEMQKKLKYAYEVAEKKVEVMKARNVQNYKSHGGAVQVGDRVLVKRFYFPEGKHKLCDKWEEEVYVVVGRMDPDLPVYDVRREHNPKGGRTKRLHRNHLLPIGCVQDVVEARNEMEERKEDDTSDEDFELHMSASEDEMPDSTPVVNEESAEEEQQNEERVEERRDVVEESEDSENETEEVRRSTRVRMPTDRYQSVDFRR